MAPSSKHRLVARYRKSSYRAEKSHPVPKQLIALVVLGPYPLEQAAKRVVSVARCSLGLTRLGSVGQTVQSLRGSPLVSLLQPFIVTSSTSYRCYRVSAPKTRRSSRPLDAEDRQRTPQRKPVHFR